MVYQKRRVHVPTSLAHLWPSTFEADRYPLAPASWIPGKGPRASRISLALSEGSSSQSGYSHPASFSHPGMRRLRIPVQ